MRKFYLWKELANIELAKSITKPEDVKKTGLWGENLERVKDEKVFLDSILPLPIEQWGLVAKVIAKLAIPEDIGLGSTIERKIDKNGGKLFKKYYKKLMGRDCNCHDRAILLNIRYPYKREKAGD